MINIIELESELVSNILFNQLEIRLDENSVFIEICNKKDSEIISEILDASDEFSSDEYELIKYNEYEFLIKFNDKIEFIDENEYVNEIKENYKYIESLLDESDIFSDEYESEYY